MIRSLKEIDRTQKIFLKQIYADPLIKMKKYAEAYTTLGPGVDKNGRPVTGLTEDRVDIVKGSPVNIKGTRVPMEGIMDLAEGTLKQTSAFWIAYNIKIGSERIELDLQSPDDLLRYMFAVAQTIVANGLHKIKDDSRVEFVLYSEEQEAKERVTERRSLSKAYVLADKLDLETKMNILNVYGIITDASSPNSIEDKIGEKIEEDPKKFLAMVDDADLIYKSMVTKCLDKGVLTMKDGAIKHGEINVGFDKDSAAKAIGKDITLQAVLKAKLSGDMDLIKKAMTPEKKEEKKKEPAK